MPTHPSDEDQDWLLEQLALLLDRLGTDLFLGGPIIEPSSHFFPDAYETEAGAVRVVARRLLHWAGRELGVDVDMDHAPDPARHITIWRLYGHPVRERTLLVEVAEIGRSDQLAGALSHVVARAIRSDEGFDRLRGTPYRGGGEHNEEGLELQLATLTTVPLGWGLLALGAAERHHTGGGVEGNWQSYEVATERHGGLTIPELAFLLAAQLVVRDYTIKGAKRVAHHVPPNARKFLLDWFTKLTPRRNILIEELGLPDPKTWPVATYPVDPPEPFPVDPPADLAHPERERRNWRRPVFRVAEHRGVAFGIGAGFIGVLAAGGLRLPPFLLIGLTLATSVVGFVAGRRVKQDMCSDPGCGKRIEPGALRCEGCGGIVAGRIASSSKRLDGEEQLPASFWSEHDLDPPDADEGTGEP